MMTKKPDQNQTSLFSTELFKDHNGVSESYIKSHTAPNLNTSIDAENFMIQGSDLIAPESLQAYENFYKTLTDSLKRRKWPTDQDVEQPSTEIALSMNSYKDAVIAYHRFYNDLLVLLNIGDPVVFRETYTKKLGEYFALRKGVSTVPPLSKVGSLQECSFYLFLSIFVNPDERISTTGRLRALGLLTPLNTEKINSSLENVDLSDWSDSKKIDEEPSRSFFQAVEPLLKNYTHVASPAELKSQIAADPYFNIVAEKLRIAPDSCFSTLISMLSLPEYRSGTLAFLRDLSFRGDFVKQFIVSPSTTLIIDQKFRTKGAVNSVMDQGSLKELEMLRQERTHLQRENEQLKGDLVKSNAEVDFQRRCLKDLKSKSAAETASLKDQIDQLFKTLESYMEYHCLVMGIKFDYLASLPFQDALNFLEEIKNLNEKSNLLSPASYHALRRYIFGKRMMRFSSPPPEISEASFEGLAYRLGLYDEFMPQDPEDRIKFLQDYTQIFLKSVESNQRNTYISLAMAKYIVGELLK